MNDQGLDLMYTVVKNAVIRNLLRIYNYLATDKNENEFSQYGLTREKSNQDDSFQVETIDPISHFGEAISDAEYLISKKMYREALGIYRKLNNGLTGKDELMKIQFVREKIEVLLSMINDEPTAPEAAQVIEEEKKSAAERYKATIVEADHYFEHELYNESMFLYRKLLKEWSNSNDFEKINVIKEKIAFLNELVDDSFKISFQSMESEQGDHVKVQAKTNDLTRLFGEMISDAEHLVSKKMYREALGIYRKLNGSLAGSGELMKIQFVRDKIESLFNRINAEPSVPEAAKIIAEEKKSAEERYAATILEADNYYKHELYNEALFLYRKLEKEWAKSGDHKKISAIREKVEVLTKLVRDTDQQDDSSQVVYLAEDGTLTDNPPEIPRTFFTKIARNIVAVMLNQRFFLILAHICIVVAGIYCFITSPFEKMPSVDRGEVHITTNYYGASVNDVEYYVTIPIEKALQELENVSSITSKSYRNVSTVAVTFADGAHYSDMFSRLKLHILNIKNKLPAGCEEPTFLFVDTKEESSVIQVNLFGKTTGTNRQILAEKLKTVLSSIQGVREIEISGKSKNEVHVTLSPEKLKNQGVAFHDVTEAIKIAGLRNYSGHTGSDTSGFSPSTGFSREEDILNVIVRKDGQGNIVRLADVVTNTMLSQLDPMNLSSINGEEAISLIVRKNDTAHAISLARQVKSLSDEFFQKHKDEGLKINFTDDSTQEIIDEVKTFNWDLITGLILVASLLWVCFGLRSAIISVLFIPFAFLCTLVAKMVLGIPVYTVNLFVFILVAGIVVDNIIVIVENINRHHQMDKPLRRSVIDGVAEVFWPVLIFMMTTVIAFIPMFLISGPAGSFIVMIPLAVIFALCSSLVGALFFLPVHVFQWGNKQESSTQKDDARPIEQLSKAWTIYERILDQLLNHRRQIMPLIVFLFIACVAVAGLSLSGIVPMIHVKMFPVTDLRYHVTVALPSNTAIHETDAVIRDVSKYILSLGEKQVATVSGTAGYFRDRDDGIHEGGQYGQIVLALPQRSEARFPENPENDPDKQMDYIFSKLSAYLNGSYPEPNKRPRVNFFPEHNGHVAENAIHISISGDNLDQTLEVSNRVRLYLKNEKETQALGGIGDDRAPIIKVINYSPNSESSHEQGLRDRITEILAGALKSVPVGKFHTSTEEIDLKVKLDRKPKPGEPLITPQPQDVLDLPVVDQGTHSAPILFRDLVIASQINEPDFINRINGKSTVILSAYPQQGAMVDTEQVKTLVSGFFETFSKDYPDITLDFNDQPDPSANRFNAFFVGLFIAFSLMYLILALRFGDFIQPVIVFTTLAFSIIGVVLGMLLIRTTLTAGSLMALVGITIVTTNNAMLLIEFMNMRIKEGKPMHQAIKESCRARFRPMLVSTVTLMIWLLPMALGLPFTSLEWAPMAATFIAGLGLSTLLTLFIVPVEYELASVVKSIVTSDPI